MKRSTWRIGAICGLFVFTLGCDGGSTDEPPEVSAAQVMEETREAAHAVADYAATRHQEFADRAQKAFDDVGRELADARRELGDVPEQTRKQLASAIERAEQAQKELGDELDELRNAGEDSWDTTKERVSNALDEVAEARREVTAALAGNESETDTSS